MAINDYKVSHSNYTIKKKHKIATNGTIYERDYMTTLTPGVWKSDMFSYGEGNFKMVHRRTNDDKRKRYYGGFVKPECSGETEYWDSKCLEGYKETSDGTIKLKPDYSTLSDFAYFGSLEKLFKNTVTNIISNYPGELYGTSRQDSYWDGARDRLVGSKLYADIIQVKNWYTETSGRTWFIENISGTTIYQNLIFVENPLGINYKTNQKEGDTETSLHYLLDTATLYGIFNDGQFTGNVVSATLVATSPACNNGDMTAIIEVQTDQSRGNKYLLFEYYFDGEYRLYGSMDRFQNHSFRPYRDEDGRLFINEYFDSLTDFGSLLLNKRDRGYDITEGSVQMTLGGDTDVTATPFVVAYDVDSNMILSDYSQKTVMLRFTDITPSDPPVQIATVKYIANTSDDFATFGRPSLGDLGITTNNRTVLRYANYRNTPAWLPYKQANTGESVVLNNSVYQGPPYTPAFNGDVFQWNGTEWANITHESFVIESVEGLPNGMTCVLRKENSADILKFTPLESARIDLSKTYTVKVNLSINGEKRSVVVLIIPNVDVFDIPSADNDLIGFLNQGVSFLGYPTTLSLGEGITIHGIYNVYIYDENGLHATNTYYAENPNTNILLCSGSNDVITYTIFPAHTFDFSCTVNKPYEDENGFTKYIRETYTWPTTNGYNLDASSSEFENYVANLLDIIAFYEEGYTNNVWNRMTHSSIKNMDRTFEKTNSDENEEDFKLGTLRMEAMIQVASQMFDGLKAYADGIKNVNSVTYDENGNTPDYFLSDTLELSGWEVSDPTIGLKPNDGGKTNTQFYRNLKINSRDILSRKGTRHGIEMLLNLFGLKSYDFARLSHDSRQPTSATKFDTLSVSDKKKLYDYKIEEMVYTALGAESGDIDDTLDIEKYNQLKNSYDFGKEDTLQGLPCIFIYKDGKKYIVPWVKDVTEIDGEPYFQMYGGWGKKPYIENKGIYLPESATEATETYGYSYKLFDESINYVHIVKDLHSLSSIPYGELHNGDVYYVYDISDYDAYFTVEGEQYNPNITSHYFFLPNREFNTKYGTIEDPSLPAGTCGWVNIPSGEIEDGTGIGARVVYLESIIDNMKGNNPHLGNGAYDLGEEFLEYFKQLFKYSIENDDFNDDAYDCNTGELNSEIPQIGFELSAYTDNVKCWYFYEGSDLVQKERQVTIQADNTESNPVLIDSIEILDNNTYTFEFNLGIENSGVVFQFGDETWSDTRSAFTEEIVVRKRNMKTDSVDIASVEPVTIEVEPGVFKTYAYSTMIFVHQGQTIETTGDCVILNTTLTNVIGQKYTNESTSTAYIYIGITPPPIGSLTVDYLIGIDGYDTPTVDLIAYKTSGSGSVNATVRYPNTNTLIKTIDNNSTLDETPLVGASADTTFTSNLQTYDYADETTGSNSEMSALSVINTKNLKITFDGNYCQTKAFKDYFYNGILPYLKQVIPSTAIVEYN